MKLIPFEPAHLALFEPQAEQARYVDAAREPVAQIAHWFALTGLDEDGRVLGCAGLAELEDGDLGAWAVFSERVKSMPLALYRAVKRGIEIHEGRRIVAYVAPEHVKAARFVEALHFNLCETKRLDDGVEVLCYVRVN